MASMKLILLQDVEELGLAGDEIHVAAGYARNYLIPRKLAAVASTSALRQLAAHKEKIESKRKEELVAAEELAGKLAALEFEIAAQASEDGHLFGSVTDRMISEAVAAKGLTLDHQRIHIHEAIRTVGDFKVDAKLHAKVTVELKVKVAKAV